MSDNKAAVDAWKRWFERFERDPTQRDYDKTFAVFAAGFAAAEHEVAGLDHTRFNNHDWNLEWCTQQQNLKHADQAGRMRKDYWKGKRSPSASLPDETAILIRKLYAEGNASWEKLARQFNTSKRTVGRIVRGETYVRS